MIRSIERRSSDLKELIRAQEKAEVSQAEGLLKRLEQEIAELKRRDVELGQLLHTEDQIHFLKVNVVGLLVNKMSDCINSVSCFPCWNSLIPSTCTLALKGVFSECSRLRPLLNILSSVRSVSVRV